MIGTQRVRRKQKVSVSLAVKYIIVWGTNVQWVQQLAEMSVLSDQEVILLVEGVACLSMTNQMSVLSQ